MGMVMTVTEIQSALDALFCRYFISKWRSNS
nr:MAG TPA: TraM-like-terminal domain of transfer protein TraM [Caudoviricetes sp.]